MSKSRQMPGQNFGKCLAKILVNGQNFGNLSDQFFGQCLAKFLANESDLWQMKDQNFSNISESGQNFSNQSGQNFSNERPKFW